MLKYNCTDEELIKYIFEHGPCNTFGYYEFSDSIMYMRNYIPNLTGIPESKITEKEMFDDPGKAWEDGIEMIKENRDLLRESKILK